MTNEEKLNHLLNKAVENGFDTNLSNDLNNELFDIEVNLDTCALEGIRYYYYSLNDLVLNTNFFECLFKDNTIFILSSKCQYICIHEFEVPAYLSTINKVKWCLLPVKERLTWLFKQFELWTT